MSWERFKLKLKAIGPGILYAGAAIGASHLVFSTRAGAEYGFRLVWAVIFINFFKYPFFEYAYRYTAATGKSILHGYKELGPWALGTFFGVSFFTAIINFAAVTIVTASLAEYLFGFELGKFLSPLILLLVILLILFAGRLLFVDYLMKIMIFILALFTIIAVFYAVIHGSHVKPDFQAPQIWNKVGIGFLLALMGWMPTPIDAAAWPSIWTEDKMKLTGLKPTLGDLKLDFNLGFLGSAFIALFFLSLGALVMYGTGEKFSPNGVIFSGQFVNLYISSLGYWSHWIIATIAFITMFSTALTVIDGYPRSLQHSVLLLFPSLKMGEKKVYNIWVLFLSITALIILGFFTRNMKSLLEFATIISFLTAPVFAFINFKVVTARFMNPEFVPNRFLKIISYCGLVFLVGFSLVYLYFLIIK